MVVLPLVGDHEPVRVVSAALHVLPHRAPSVGALVVRSRVRAALHLLLTVLAPPAGKPVAQCSAKATDVGQHDVTAATGSLPVAILKLGEIHDALHGTVG